MATKSLGPEEAAIIEEARRHEQDLRRQISAILPIVLPPQEADTISLSPEAAAVDADERVIRILLRGGVIVILMLVLAALTMLVNATISLAMLLLTVAAMLIIAYALAEEREIPYLNPTLILYAILGILALVLTDLASLVLG